MITTMMGVNCDYNFGTLDNFGVKNYQKVSHNMILMSWYLWDSYIVEAKKFGQANPHPFSGNARKKAFFSIRDVSKVSCMIARRILLDKMVRPHKRASVHF